MGTHRKEKNLERKPKDVKTKYKFEFFWACLHNCETQREKPRTKTQRQKKTRIFLGGCLHNCETQRQKPRTKTQRHKNKIQICFLGKKIKPEKKNPERKPKNVKPKFKFGFLQKG